ncbi:MAG: hypothetical protein LKM32_09725 [Chiayiivirga sp.]|jgi:predicted DNA repair protein MutK|nr:hypothetical protein [Chiayiivirga sp.]MCI1729633.1 hypothetical protein [Chiayiivirga sp.]
MSQLSANTADARRARVRRTVLWLGVAALAVYAAFIAAGVYGLAGGHQ